MRYLMSIRVSTSSIGSFTEQKELKEVVIIPQYNQKVIACFKTLLNRSEEEAKKIYDAVYLPNDMALAQLCFLKTVSKEGKCPFNYESAQAFKESQRTLANTLWGFKLVAIPFFALSAFGGFSSFVNITNLTPIKQVGITGVINTATNFAQNMLGLKITGTNPDNSQNAADAKQNFIQELAARYKQMAAELIELKFQNPDVIPLLMEGLDLTKIRSIALQFHISETEANDMFTCLDEAVDYIKNGKMPNLFELKGIIQIQQLANRVKDLEEKLKIT